ncbi:hypothetical protein EMIHUDRAFT_227748 [Emiliania huxleyi CCMP1516]|uniref:Uncharacterized protein n=2 Tax=Emiliania huxleyi TaxID=2903 RepID=A0A0D3KHG0_EMIH1|nr:hypothetical protein EMIHUDRAFT_227748 [Emiliania huxleyi CCMP1516]EOD35195.1 hypothetical protein EMIHUDRAFT_227748 [Emiliania huxleyi CCMP1516]|eukprot:XP_005787624.1 hypothetical protein EMIHUDRAFT_227748 [Emiliania huxleyi CCMP1516]
MQKSKLSTAVATGRLHLLSSFFAFLAVLSTGGSTAALLVKVLPRATAPPPPLPPPLMITGGCASRSSALDNVEYVAVGYTFSGAPYFREASSSYYIYWDPDCSGTDSTARWIVDDDEPSTTASSDLDGDGKCKSWADIYSDDSSSPPLGTATWRVNCDSIWTNNLLTLAFLSPSYVAVGYTFSGAPYFREASSSYYIYWDPDCSGEGYPARWIVDNQEPSTTASSDLDGDGGCTYWARIDSDDSSSPPLGTATWREAWRIRGGAAFVTAYFFGFFAFLPKASQPKLFLALFMLFLALVMLVFLVASPWGFSWLVPEHCDYDPTGLIVYVIFLHGVFALPLQHYRLRKELRARIAAIEADLPERLADGSLRLLRVAWLLERPTDWVILREQDLPEEAFWAPADAARLLAEEKVAALSYKWQGPFNSSNGGGDQPDGSRFHLDEVLSYYREGRHAEERPALMWDFATARPDNGRETYRRGD